METVEVKLNGFFDTFEETGVLPCKRIDTDKAGSHYFWVEDNPPRSFVRGRSPEGNFDDAESRCHDTIKKAIIYFTQLSGIIPGGEAGISYGRSNR